jgi:hemerythrin-like domain-containing protein
MTTICEFLAPDHKRCDNLFAVAEAAAANNDWDCAEAGFNLFQEAMLHHFAMEEEVIFPAFEERTGMRQGPTSVMRSEHLQMTGMFKQMSEAIDRKDTNAYLGDADTLLIIMQQHNIKEEQMLYQMADQALISNLDELLERMRSVH